MRNSDMKTVPKLEKSITNNSKRNAFHLNTIIMPNDKFLQS